MMKALQASLVEMVKRKAEDFANDINANPAARERLSGLLNRYGLACAEAGYASALNDAEAALERVRNGAL